MYVCKSMQADEWIELPKCIEDGTEQTRLSGREAIGTQVHASTLPQLSV